MTESDKLVQRLRSGRSEVSYADVDRLLRMYGWRLANVKGSHAAYSKAVEPPIVVVTLRGRKVKRYKINYVLQRLGLED